LRILVAGGAGFVGSHLCRRLLSDGHSVHCVDNLITGDFANLADLRDAPEFTFENADVANAAERDVDVVFHLASPASPVDYERLPLETLAANSLGTWRLAELARAAGASLTFVSTSEVYGDPLVHPQPESYWGNVDPVGPRACYDEGKRFGEALVTSMRRVQGLRATIVRVFNTYGPAMRRDDGRVIPELMSAAIAGRPLVVHGDGRQTRSFMFVSDLVEGLVRIGFDRKADGEVFNLGNPHEITIRELAELVRDLLAPGKEIVSIEAREGDPRQRKPDIAKVQRWYGWNPLVPLDEGLRLTASWFAPGRPLEGAAADPAITDPSLTTNVPA
jgi:dTDP-glucose 4,6-dehydratase